MRREYEDLKHIYTFAELDLPHRRKLRDCPFCGGKADYRVQFQYMDARAAVLVSCDTCRAQAHPVFVELDTGDMELTEHDRANISKSSLIVAERWNKRTKAAMLFTYTGRRLLNCPFCGSCNVKIVTRYSSSLRGFFCFAICENCRAQTTTKKLPYKAGTLDTDKRQINEDTKLSRAELWNMRCK